MPLKEGKASATISANVGELIRSYKKSGKIGKSKPASAEQARKQAVAIAHSKARKGR